MIIGANKGTRVTIIFPTNYFYQIILVWFCKQKFSRDLYYIGTIIIHFTLYLLSGKMDHALCKYVTTIKFSDNK